MDLGDLGFSDWHRERLPADAAQVARVVAADRDRYLVAGLEGVVPAEPTGRLRYGAASAEDLPCVGDWVVAQYLDDGEHAVIHAVLPRRTILRRRTAGEAAAYQPIAANIDVAFVVQSCDVDFSLNRLDRYLVMAADGGITARLLLTKADLVAEAQVTRLTAEVARHHAIGVVALSGTTGAGFDAFARSLERGRTYCLLGSSGVGKSTLLNRLLGREQLAVAPVSETSGKGRHTTTRRQLLVLEGGALVVDTPGMRELGMMGFGEGLASSYPDIAQIADGCRYRDCTHTVEEGCAVLAAVGAGEMDPARYESYLKLFRESAHYEMTYVEQRRKDRAFGKVLKHYQKSQRDR